MAGKTKNTDIELLQKNHISVEHIVMLPRRHRKALEHMLFKISTKVRKCKYVGSAYLWFSQRGMKGKCHQVWNVISDLLMRSDDRLKHNSKTWTLASKKIRDLLFRTSAAFAKQGNQLQVKNFILHSFVIYY